MAKQKKCKICKDPFTPRWFLQKTCFEYKCIMEFKNQEEERKWKKRKAKMKEDLKTLPQYQDDLQKEVNTIVRLIDHEQTCISCGSYKKDDAQAGHYHSVGSNIPIRYHLFNIWVQYSCCNLHRGANIIGYDEGLIDLVGRELWEYIKFDIKREYQRLGLTKEEVKEKIVIARSIIKRLEKNPIKNDIGKRLELRRFINAELGIY